MNKLFIKNYYYNRTSLLKLIYMYNYLNDVSFLDKLIFLITVNHFSLNERKTEALCEIHSKLLPNVIKLDLNFGFVWIFEEKLIFYFKNDYNFDDFFTFFLNLENDYKIKWGCIEFFDKNIKIIEIFEKISLLRNFRNEVVTFGKKNTINNITETFVDCKSDNFLSFLKRYNASNIKLVVYFYNKRV